MAEGVTYSPTVTTVARAMYQAYNDQGPNPWKTFDGRSVPTWDEINDQVRGKWCAAAVEARTRWFELADRIDHEQAEIQKIIRGG